MQKKISYTYSYEAIIPSPLGALGLVIDNGALVKLDYLELPRSSKKIKLKKASGSLAKKIVEELDRYFRNGKRKFSISLKLSGTLLENRIWQAMREIPAGQSITYGELAAKFDTGARVVGNICRKNPIPIIIPCHRVVAKNNIGGYCGNKKGYSIKNKEWLLELEKV